MALHMYPRSEDVLNWISPPSDTVGFDEISTLLDNPDCITLCYRSTYRFLEEKLSEIIRNDIRGDVVLVGVWRGGLAAYAQALLAEHGELDRKLYLADTFCGFLPVDDAHPKDKIMLEYFSSLDAAQGSKEEITSRLERWGLPVKNIHFLIGDIKETTRNFSTKVSMLLIDVDFYQPTKDALEGIYHMVTPGGCVYVDDYAIEQFECREAVDSFMLEKKLNVDVHPVNKFAVFWDK